MTKLLARSRTSRALSQLFRPELSASQTTNTLPPRSKTNGRCHGVPGLNETLKASNVSASHTTDQLLPRWKTQTVAVAVMPSKTATPRGQTFQRCTHKQTPAEIENKWPVLQCSRATRRGSNLLASMSAYQTANKVPPRSRTAQRARRNGSNFWVPKRQNPAGSLYPAQDPGDVDVLGNETWLLAGCKVKVGRFGFWHLEHHSDKISTLKPTVYTRTLRGNSPGSALKQVCGL